MGKSNWAKTKRALNGDEITGFYNLDFVEAVMHHSAFPTNIMLRHPGGGETKLSFDNEQERDQALANIQKAIGLPE